MTAAYQTNPKLDAERAKLRATDEEVSRAELGSGLYRLWRKRRIRPPTHDVGTGIGDRRTCRSLGVQHFHAATGFQRFSLGQRCC